MILLVHPLPQLFTPTKKRLVQKGVQDFLAGPGWLVFEVRRLQASSTVKHHEWIPYPGSTNIHSNHMIENRLMVIKSPTVYCIVDV